MRKFIAAVVVLFLLIVVAMPYYTGIRAEEQIRDLVGTYSKIPGIKLQITDYKRGWYRSHVKLELQYLQDVNVANSKVDLSQFKLTLDEWVRHGPFFFDNGMPKVALAQMYGAFELSPMQQKIYNQVFANVDPKPQLTNNVIFAFNGDVELRLNLPPFVLDQQPLGKLEWKGLNSRWMIKHDLSNIKGDMNIDGLKVSSPFMNLDLQNLGLSYKEQSSNDANWTGKGDLHLDKLQVTRGMVTLFSIDDFDATSQNDVKDDILGGQMTIQVKKLFADGQSYGPGKLNTTVSQLDAKALAELQQMAEQFSNLPSQAQAIMNGKMMMQLVAVLSKGATLNLKQLHITLPQGDLSASGTLGLPAISSDKQANPMALIQQIQAKVLINLPAELAQLILQKNNLRQLYQQQRLKKMMVQQQGQQASDPQAVTVPKLLSKDEVLKQANTLAQTQIQNWVKQGYLEPQDKNYKLTIVFKDGKFTINDKPYQPGVMQGKIEQTKAAQVQ